MRRIVLTALFLVCLTACGGGDETNAATTTLAEEVSLITTTQLEASLETPTTLVEQIVEAIPTTTTTVDLSWAGPVYPLTGLPAYEGIPETPAVVVKLGNNNQNSLPQYGLREADIVYDMHIEGGKSRFMAIYHSRLPEIVMPIRSARSSDINLLLNLNHPVFAYWGSNDIVLSELQAAERVGGFDRRSASSQGSQYFDRDSSRSIPANGKANTEDLQGTASNEAGTPLSIFEYGELTQNAVPAAGVQWEMAQRVVDYVWNSSLEQWVRYQDGAPHLDENRAPLTADNLLFLYVRYRISDADPISPQAISTGAGDGWLLRDGTVTGVTWERSRSSNSWTIIDDESGETVTLDVGTTWVTLARPGEGSILSSAEAIELIG